MDIVGQKFSRWTVIASVDGLSKSNHSRFLARCDCGTERVVLGYKLRRGSSTSCGCFANEKTSQRVTTHGLTNHRLFKAWNGMMARCYNPKDQAFAHYGGRGITVCDRWHDVEAFIADNDADFEPGLTIDRIKNDEGYRPGNIRWTTHRVQNRNYRRNVMITHDGRTQCLFDWAAEVGIKPRTLWARIRVSKWSVERALQP